ncbi:TatD family hydrolase [Paenibacillus sp. 1P03SA]|uniref:TatD family hydrolase n=1 Tax=Paenibacillus sp. 1P03SA TaxID=3132294 RepID=UPI0039A066AB
MKETMVESMKKSATEQRREQGQGQEQRQEQIAETTMGGPGLETNKGAVIDDPQAHSPGELRYIDAHIHLEQYGEREQTLIFQDIADGIPVSMLLAVSMNLASCERTRLLHRRYPRIVRPAYGFHPEQPLPSADELEELLGWMEETVHEAAAVGEIGLPYYMRTEAEKAGPPFYLQPYVDLLERFIAFAAKHKKPVVLHAVYEDADLVLDLLERYGIERAHFHWFKGSEKTVERMIGLGYYISITPDISYEEEIRQLAARYPLELMMAETDGPWPFEGPYDGRMTHPLMVTDVVRHIAGIKSVTVQDAAAQVYKNTCTFYSLQPQSYG